MDSKDKIRVANTSVSSGLVFASITALYRMGTIANMLEAYPIIKAFLIPILVFCVIASVVYATFFVPSAIYSLLPGVRWGRKFHEKCSRLARIIASAKTFNPKVRPKLIVEVESLEMELRNYNIHCPPIMVNSSDSARLWRNFLIIVENCAKQHDVKRARKAFDEMLPDDRELWDHMNSVLEEMYC